MSVNQPLLETLIIVSPDERLKEGVRDRLPLYVNVVEPFTASQHQADKLVKLISPTLFRNVFEITGLEHKDRGIERLQRLGGMVLHHVHDEVIGAMDRLKIPHDDVAWPDETTDTWYSGTWQVPNSRTGIKKVHLAQEMPESENWQVLHTFDLKVSDHDFRQDPLYIDSLINPVNKRKAS